MDIDFRKRTIFAVIQGSHAIGTASDDSDIDIRSIFIPPLDWYSNLGSWRPEIMGDFLNFFEPSSEEVITIEGMVGRKMRRGEHIDTIMIDFKHFINMVCDGSGVATDMLYVDPKFHIVTTKFSDLMLSDSVLSLTPWVKFRYYANALYWARQLRDYIKIYFERTLLPSPPTRKDFGLPQEYSLPYDKMCAVTTTLIDRFEIWISDSCLMPGHIKNENILATVLDAWFSLTKYGFRMTTDLTPQHNQEPLSTPMEKFQDFEWGLLFRAALFDLDYNFVERFIREWHYKTALDISCWAEKCFAKLPLLKRYLHIIRRLRVSKEILTGEKLHFCRNDAQVLLDIKNGKWSFDEIFEEINRLNMEINTLYFDGNLPKISRPEHSDKTRFVNELIDMASGLEDLRCKY